MKARFKPKFNIKKGDNVVVITGDDKDLSKPRLVKEVLIGEKNTKVIVEGVNIVTKHSKPSAQNTKGGIVKKEAPIHISNVMLWDAAQKAGARVTRVRKEGKTERVFKTKKVQGGKK
ncbi:MAG: 50S ribosomal protein L24 [Chitinophagaceae bacterium]|nr:50S ribosomal protein L24 [Chitinophagaceae bacterium]MBP6588582.1 50S ribosomal protein L24 [Chitinophagaceae bacterium]